jgi:sugar phosphate permease
VAYASFIFCRSFFAVTQAAMKADPGIRLTDAQANNIITSFGVAFGLAKFPAGILVNACPPRAALISFMITTSAFVALASHPWCDNYTKIMVIALLNAIPQAGAYPAVTKLVCAGFEPANHSSVFALISIGSRAGQVAVSLVLGEVLRRYGDWRVAIQVAPLVVMAALCLVVLLTHGKPTHVVVSDTKVVEEEAPLVQAPLSQRLKRLLTNPRFWLVNCASSMLLISKAFDTYAVRYITDICNYLHPVACVGACTCKAYAAQMTAGVSMGIVTSLLFGSWVYEKLKGDGSTRSKRAMFIIALCAMNLAIALGLFTFTLSTYASPSESYVDANEEESEKRQMKTLLLLGFLLFFLGFSSGYPFYVPQSLFAVEDASDAATVVGCGESVQSVLAAVVLITAQQ